MSDRLGEELTSNLVWSACFIAIGRVLAYTMDILEVPADIAWTILILVAAGGLLVLLYADRDDD